jgi:Fic family protein
LNIPFLILKIKIQEPILYLSKYIIENINKYYRLLKIRNEDTSNIPSFVMYILREIADTSKNTIELIMSINRSFEITKEEMKERLTDIYKFNNIIKVTLNII